MKRRRSNKLIVKCVRDLGATAISITHDMVSARHIADRIAMIYEGQIIWSGPAGEINRILMAIHSIDPADPKLKETAVELHLHLGDEFLRLSLYDEAEKEFKAVPASSIHASAARDGLRRVAVARAGRR